MQQSCARTSFSSPLKYFHCINSTYYNYNYNSISHFLNNLIPINFLEKFSRESRTSSESIDESNDPSWIHWEIFPIGVPRTRINQKGERFEERFWKGGKTLYAYTRSWYTLSDCFFSVWKSTHCGVGRATVARQIYFWLRLLGNRVCSHDW